MARGSNVVRRFMRQLRGSVYFCRRKERSVQMGAPQLRKVVRVGAGLDAGVDWIRGCVDAGGSGFASTKRQLKQCKPLSGNLAGLAAIIWQNWQVCGLAGPAVLAVLECLVS